MPDIHANRLTELLQRIYVARGVPEAAATTMTRHQVLANLCGHDSHGVLRTDDYARWIGEGRIVPTASFEIVEEHPASLVVDGHRGIGFVVTERALALAMEKARTVGVAALTVRHQSHIGRLGAYTQMAAEAGFAAILMADSGRAPKSVAPFGGSDRRLGTNPVSIALPADVPGNIVLDMATSAVAGGKVKVAVSKGIPLGNGWAIDRHGAPTTDPAAFLDGGSLLPLGGDQGHKGYGLSFVIESLAAVLAGIGYGSDAEAFPNDGIFLVLMNIAMFRPLDAFRAEMGEFARYVTASPPGPGSQGVLYPGEIEHRTAEQRLRDGVSVPQRVLDMLEALAADPQAVR